MRRAWLVKLFLVLFLGAVSQANAAPAPVGRIALSVGDAKRIDIEGRVAPLRLGTLISEGDRIITGGDAVAIIVFVDEARLSMRADSELLVKQYKVDPTGVDTHLDFELVRGGIRQISGQAARLRPERYRLNTPIASIGVRGTDFLAKTSADAVETFVQEGKIVILSNFSACMGLAQIGTCAPLADISATDSARYLRVLAGGHIERRVVAADEIERLFGISLVKANTGAPATTVAAAPAIAKTTELARAVDGAAKPAAVVDPFAHDLRTPDEASKPTNSLPLAASTLVELKTISTESMAPVVVAPVVVTPVAPVVVPNTAPVLVVVAPPVPEVPVAPSPPVAVAQPTPPTPVMTLHNTPDLSRQMVWGRFSNADELPLQMWVPYASAQEGRSVTVGELGQYALWRTGPTQSISSTLKGEVQFDIHAGEAYYQKGSQVLPAQISNPALSINFDKATFSSSLTVSQAQIGSAALQISGKMNDEGVFSATSPGQLVAGAVSLNGKEAGLLFSRDYAAGAFKGMTLWNAR